MKCLGEKATWEPEQKEIIYWGMATRGKRRQGQEAEAGMERTREWAILEALTESGNLLLPVWTGKRIFFSLRAGSGGE